MKKLRCGSCNGSKQIMGGGMMMQDCENCDGMGYTREADEEELDKLLEKNTKPYIKAKKKILNLDKNMTDEEAEAILDRELRNIKEISGDS